MKSVEHFIGARLRCCKKNCNRERVFNADNDIALMRLIKDWGWKIKGDKAWCEDHK